MRAEEYLSQTFKLAQQAQGRTWPNPLVGAVIVKDGKIIGQGYHQAYGKAHAEVEALNSCVESPEGATIYVNLEPCCHTQKQTPPCAQRLVAEKIKKVVLSNLDPNPLVSGKGVELLRENGIEVETGVLAQEGEKINEVFFHAQRKKLPFIYLKMASTLDGKIALSNGQSQWITGIEARKYVHQLRSEHQAIMAGAQTIIHDNPQLNVRLEHFSGPQPVRVIFTKSGKLPEDARIFTDHLKHQTLVYTHSRTCLNLPSENIIQINSLEEALRDLFERKLINLFLEGGQNLATAFLREGFVNRVGLFLNPSFLGAGKSILDDLGLEKLNERPFLKQIQSQWMDGDFFITGRVN